MPKLTQYGETIEVSDEKAAVYTQQGWQLADEAPAEDDGAAKTAVKRPAKKAVKKS